MKKLLLILSLLGIAAYAGTNNLPQVSSRVILLDHVNQPRTALSGVLVPRDTSGTVTDIASDLGSSTYRWGNVYSKFFKILHDTSTNAVTVTAPSPVPTAYTITVPSAPPASTLPIDMDSSGNLSTSQVTAAQIVTNINLPGNGIQIGSKVAVVSNVAPSTTNLAIVRTCFNGSGTLTVGEGSSVTSHASAGLFGVTFTNAYSDTPLVTVTPFVAGGTPIVAITTAIATSSFSMKMTNLSGTATDTDFCFIAIGQK